MEKLKGTTSQVADLKAKLAAQESELAVKNEEANKLIQVVGAETEKVRWTDTAPIVLVVIVSQHGKVK